MCHFRAAALCLHGNQKLEAETSILFTFLQNQEIGHSPSHFHGVPMNDVPIVGDLLLLTILLCDTEVVEGNSIAEFIRQKVQKYENTVQLLRYNNHICYVSNINAVFQIFFRCLNFDTFSHRSFILERHLTTFTERVKTVCPKNVNQTQEILFDKVDSFRNEHTNE